MTAGVTDLVRGATVEIHGDPDSGGRTFRGTGFLVAPGRVLTCAHVLGAGTPRVRLPMADSWIDAEVLAREPTQALGGGPMPWPDAAVLGIAETEHPCVPLPPPGFRPPATDGLLLFGHSGLRVTRPEPDTTTQRFGELVGDGLYRLDGTLIAPGLSGGPVLHLRSLTVVGMTKGALSAAAGFGGYAVPIDDALAVGGTEELRAGNATAFVDGLAALRRRQAFLGTLPDDLRLAIDGPALAALVAQLERAGVPRPETVADGDLAEWVARRLLGLSLDELVAPLYQVRAALGDRARQVVEILACCVATSRGGAAWVHGDAALALRGEWEEPSPRVVRVVSDAPETLRFLLRRARGSEVRVLDALPTSAEVDAAGHSVQLFDDVDAAVRAQFDCTKDEWPQIRDSVLGLDQVRLAVYRLDPCALADVAELAELRERFAGLHFLIASRGAQTPPDSSSVLLVLRPEVDRGTEIVGLGSLSVFDRGSAA